MLFYKKIIDNLHAEIQKDYQELEEKNKKIEN